MPLKSSALTFDRLPVAMAALDAHHVVVEANAAFRGLLGEGVRGRSLRQVLDDAGAAEQDGVFGRVYSVGRAGAESAFRICVHPRDDGLLAVLTDAPAAPEATTKPPLTEDVRQRLMHDAEIGTWRYDPDAEVYHFSSELSLGHGGIARPVPLAMLQLLQHRDDRETDAAIRERITREGGAAESEIRYLGADGQWTHLRVHYRAGARLPSGLYELHGVSQSITPLAKARDEARTNTQRLGLALKASRAGVFEYDFKKRTFWATPEFGTLVGDDAMARVLDDPLSILLPDDRAAVAGLAERASSATGEMADVRLRRPDGDRWVRLCLEVEQGPDGAPRRGLGLMIDIDEAKRQEIAVAEARRVAEEATAAKSDFLASVSHEIRTPMNGVVGVLNLLGREPLSNDGRQLLAEARGCAEMLSQLINDVLDFSKIEAGKLTLSPEPIDPAAIAESVANLLRPQAEAKGLQLTVEVAEGLGWAEADPVRLRQCLFNLVGNAVKFTEAGGVTVRLSERADGPERKLRIEVADTGIGVPDAARSALFGRFEQVERGSARRFGGTGLGLAIARQLARMMGGDLDYESEEGVGSTFWFEVAAPRVAAPAATGEHDWADAPLAGLRVLVVDDNRVNRLVGAKTLEALGAGARAVDGGAAAIEAVREELFDLVLMDVNMPGMDGLEATRRLRALGFEAPVLALTADVMRRQQDAYLAAGMDGLVPKPFAPGQLMAEIIRVTRAADAVAAS